MAGTISTALEPWANDLMEALNTAGITKAEHVTEQAFEAALASVSKKLGVAVDTIRKGMSGCPMKGAFKNIPGLSKA